VKINRTNIFFSTLLILAACFFSLSYNLEARILAEGTIQSGQINYPNGFNLYRVISINSWSLPIQIISILVKINISPLIISKIILFTSTLMFLIGVFLITKFFTKLNLVAFLVSFLVILLKKNFGHLDYPTMIFSENSNGMIAQAMFTMVFGFLINNNLKLGFFFSVLLIPVHLTIGLWLNFIIFCTLISRFKIYRNIILNKKNFFFIFVASVIVLISFFYSFSQKLPFDAPYDLEIYKTYMEVWDGHRTGYGLYSNYINYEYISKTLTLVLLISIFLKLKLNKDNYNFGLSALLINCIFSFFLYISYKFFYVFFPDLITRTIPTRFFLLHSIIGWPIIFSILFVLIRSMIPNLKYVHIFFTLILILHFAQHHSTFIERYNGIKYNLSILYSYKINNEFWYKIKNINIDGFVLGSSGFDTCVKTIALAKKPLFFCPQSLDLIPYFPSAATTVKKIVEEVYNIPFDNPKVKHLGGILNDDLKPSFQNKSYNDWIYLKNQFNITSLIVPKTWQIKLKIFLSNDKYNFYIIQ